MMKVSLYIPLLFLSYFSVSCIKEEAADNQVICRRDVNLIYDWSHGQSLLSADSLVIIAADGTTTSIKTDNVGTTLKLAPSTYTVVAYEPSKTIRVKGTTLTLGVGTDGYVTEPEPMSAGLTSFIVGEQETQQRILPMYYQTRELIVQVNFTGLGTNTLASVEGWLEGIAVARQMANGFPPLDGVAQHPAITGGKIAYVLDEKPPTSAVKQFATGRRLLGLDGATAQILRLTFHFTGGYRDTAIDVTSALSTFHTVNVFEPFVIAINIFIHEDFNADIVDWQAGSQSEIEAV